MYTTLDFLVVLNARRLIVGASPDLKFRSTDESDIAHVVSELPTARKPWLYLISRLRWNRHISCVQCERATLPILNHMPQTFSLLPVCRPVLSKGAKQVKNSEALINFAINLAYEYFCFVIYFSKSFVFKFYLHFFLNFISNIFFYFISNIFLNFISKIFFKFYFQKFFSKFLFQIFFPNFFFKFFFKILKKIYFQIFFFNFFFKIYFKKFFSQNFFLNILFQNIFLWICYM